MNNVQLKTTPKEKLNQAIANLQAISNLAEGDDNNPFIIEIASVTADLIFEVSSIMNKYPPEWPFIARAIKHYAHWCCEHCHRPHNPKMYYTLTVHHLDGDKANCTFNNLVALCQRCHLRIQATYYPGQAFMFGAPTWAVIRGLVTPPFQQKERK